MLATSVRSVNFPRVLAAITLVSWMANAIYAQPGRFAGSGMSVEKHVESESGFLFVDGTYLPPPYKIEADIAENLIRVNGREYPADAFDLARYSSRGPGMRGGAGPRGLGGRHDGARHGDVPMIPTANALAVMVRELDSLNGGAVAILQTKQPPMILQPGEHGQEFLESLISIHTEPHGAVVIPDNMPSPADQENWRQLLGQFEASPELIERAVAQVESFQAIAQANINRQAAIELAGRLSYPLTMFALVLVVFAVGHLLINSQPMFANIDDASTLDQIKKATVVCLVIVALMSVIDLVWTLIAHQSGSMRELNPLGNRLISDPTQLMVFKIVVTSISIGLLFRFRELAFARRATWWCCLVLTLLTARWLTFHSLLA